MFQKKVGTGVQEGRGGQVLSMVGTQGLLQGRRDEGVK